MKLAMNRLNKYRLLVKIHLDATVFHNIRYNLYSDPDDGCITVEGTFGLRYEVYYIWPEDPDQILEFMARCDQIANILNHYGERSV